MNNNLNIEKIICGIPKAELHLHIEGTLEPELMFKLSERNKISLNQTSVEEIKNAYNFHNLQSFLDIYYEGARVLIKEEDFYELTLEYLKKIHSQNVIHTEIFFDPQTHLERGIPFNIFFNGIYSALEYGKKEFGISYKIIMCFLRHLPVSSAIETLNMAIPYLSKISGVGLDSSELGNPPHKFKEVFKKAKELGLLPVAHAGEEGPPEYIWEAINDLNVLRIDHGVRSVEDKKLVEYLVSKKIPLTVCPLSNIKLAVFNSLENHNLKIMIDKGLCVTINSDDPSYFGGYINENFIECYKAMKLSLEDIIKIVKNSYDASFLTMNEKQDLHSRLNKFLNMNNII